MTQHDLFDRRNRRLNTVSSETCNWTQPLNSWIHFLSLKLCPQELSAFLLEVINRPPCSSSSDHIVSSVLLFRSTYLLLAETLISNQSLSFPHFMELKYFAAFTRASHWPLFCANQNRFHSIYLRIILILSSYKTVGLPRGPFFFRFSSKKFVSISLTSISLFTPCPSHPILFDHLINTCLARISKYEARQCVIPSILSLPPLRAGCPPH